MSTLTHTARELIHGGIHPSTRKVYDSAQRQYIQFCNQYGLQILPASENTILLYIAHMYLKSLKASTMKVYLASIRMLHIESNHCHSFESNSRVQLAVRAVQMGQAPPKRKLPITLSILSRIYDIIQNKLSDYNVLLIWAAMSVGHFGCMRSGEFTVNTTFNSKIHLSRSDVMFFHSPPHNKYVKIHIKTSKTDVANHGVDIIIGN